LEKRCLKRKFIDFSSVPRRQSQGFKGVKKRKTLESAYPLKPPRDVAGSKKIRSAQRRRFAKVSKNHVKLSMRFSFAGHETRDFAKPSNNFILTNLHKTAHPRYCLLQEKQ